MGSVPTHSKMRMFSQSISFLRTFLSHIFLFLCNFSFSTYFSTPRSTSSDFGQHDPNKKVRLLADSRSLRALGACTRTEMICWLFSGFCGRLLLITFLEI